jgi:hypothetical protein
MFDTSDEDICSIWLPAGQESPSNLKISAQFGGDRVLGYVIPVPSFIPLAAYPKTAQGHSNVLPETGELSLLEASLFLGNFEAFQSLIRDRSPNNRLLHLSALLVLPKFVKWLLAFQDPNHVSEEYDNMIPLACVYVSKLQY